MRPGGSSLFRHQDNGRNVSIKLFGSFVRYESNKTNLGSVGLAAERDTMASPLPLRPSIDHTPRTQSAIDLGEESSTEVFESLAAETARDIVSTLADGPATASDIAERVDTSLQNVHYHLSKLRDADLVTDVGTWYSSKGREMTVYAVTSERLELRIGDGGSSTTSDTTQRYRASHPSARTSLESD